MKIEGGGFHGRIMTVDGLVMESGEVKPSPRQAETSCKNEAEARNIKLFPTRFEVEGTNFCTRCGNHKPIGVCIRCGC